MKPTSIKKISPNELRIVWEDKHETTLTFERLRDSCPCAGCSGETVLLHEYKPPVPDRLTLGRYDLKSIQTVGSYAVQLTWADGHNTGIYTFDYLNNFPP